MVNHILACFDTNPSNLLGLRNHWDDIVLGLLTSAIAGIFAFTFNRLYLRIKLYYQYKKITGKWLSFSFMNDYSFDKKKMIGEIEISRISNYVFHIQYNEKENPNEWEGDIFMNREMSSIGKIYWRYIKLSGQPTKSTPWSGFKDLVIEKNDKHGIALRIISEHDKGFYDELLIRK